ncbi:hypothetical protein F2Q69_00038575 [Brassica cretica]|uniref:Uncharacterized protein n=1 Tax=Brassica cretica TaxID=69181 RepID=A0A8S9SRQ5_BRACR|nr:hypothetical protein F2Q69_00038575 [Brassica cretica]
MKSKSGYLRRKKQRERERERTSTTLSLKQMQILSSTFFRRMEEDAAIVKEIKKSLRDEVEA